MNGIIWNWEPTRALFPFTCVWNSGHGVEKGTNLTAMKGNFGNYHQMPLTVKQKPILGLLKWAVDQWKKRIFNYSFGGRQYSYWYGENISLLNTLFLLFLKMKYVCVCMCVCKSRRGSDALELWAVWHAKSYFCKSSKFCVPSLQPLVLVVFKNNGFAELFEVDSTHISPCLFISSSLELPKAINGKILYFHMTPEAS